MTFDSKDEDQDEVIDASIPLESANNILQELNLEPQFFLHMEQKLQDYEH